MLFSQEGKEASRLEDRLDRLEKIPLVFAEGKPSMKMAWDLLHEAELFLSKYDPLGPSVDLFQLRRKTTALSYRLGIRHGGNDPETTPDRKSLAILSSMARSRGFNLSKDRKEYLEKVSRYPDFTSLLLASENFLESFFNWSLRDGVAPDVFIQYPVISSTLQKAFLAERIGVINKKSLKVKYESFSSGIVLKDVVLDFEGKEVSILDENERVRFQPDWILPLDKVWKIFKNKHREIGNLEFLRKGISNWNAFQLGSWNPKRRDYDLIDITKPSWWKQLPFVEVLNLSEAEDRYGYRLDGVHWNIAASATRLKKNLDYNGSHAFFEVAVPLGQSRYAVYPLGKFAKRFPTSYLDGLSFFGHTVPATVASPDPNIFYTDRKRVWQSFAVEKEAGYSFLEEIRKEILRSRQDSAVYQIESENCAKWTQEILEQVLGKKAVPELYRMSLLDTEPGGVMERIFALLKKLPGQWGVRLFAFLHFPLKPWVGTSIWKDGKRVFLSLVNTHFWQTSWTHLPGMLHELQQSLFKTTYFKYITKNSERFYTDFLAHRLKKSLKKQGGRVFVLKSGEKALKPSILALFEHLFYQYIKIRVPLEVNLA